MKSKAKILLLGKLPPPMFGPALATKILLNSDLKRHYHLLHLDTRLNRSIASMYRIHPSKFARLLWLYGKMFYLMTRYRPHIVVIPISQSTSGFFKDLPFIYLASALQSRTIIHLRGSRLKSWLQSQPLTLYKLFYASLNRCYGGIVLGNNLRYLFQDIFPAHRVFVVPNGGDFRFPENQSNTNLFTILFLSNIQPSKGIWDVIKTAQLLQSRFPGAFQIKVAGNWHNDELEKSCKAFCRQHRLGIDFYSNTTQQKKNQLLADADLFLFPPRGPEGHPWVIVEAMAAGLPIIATDQGAIRESVIHGDNGYLVDVAQPGQIADRIIELYSDRQKCEQMAKNSLNYYQQQFTEDRMVQNLATVFDKVLAESKPDSQTSKTEIKKQME
ncbi:glycosyltransferase [candidate division KSB1 bacterium]|nr:glycosyltransferase [candidate division KSB1 bacterium]